MKKTIGILIRSARRIFVLLLIAVLIVMNLPEKAFANPLSGAEDAGKEGYLTYYLSGTKVNGVYQSDTKVIILECDTKATGEIIIPEKIEGFPVKEIYAWAFQNCEKVTSVYIPKDVNYIEEFAFAGCVNLEKYVVDVNNECYENDENGILFTKNRTAILRYPITRVQDFYSIPDSVIEIKGGAFAECKNLKEVVVPSGVINIGVGAFQSCENLVNINIPYGVSLIEREVFYACKSMKNIIIPKSVMSIGKRAFDSCSNLTSVEMSDSVTSIGDNAFYLCENLTDIVIPQGVKTIGEQAFGCCDNLTRIEIPNSVTYIGNGLFTSCDNLVDVILPKGITSIPSRTFSHCTSLTDFIIPETVTNIGSAAFARSGLTSIHIPNSVTNIGFGAFDRCTKINHIEIPDSVISIESEAFRDCNFETVIIGDGVTDFTGFEFTSNLKSIQIGNGIIEISSELFQECSSLKSILVGSSVKKIGTDVFDKCTSLIEISVDANNPYYSSDDGVLYNKEGTRLIKFPVGKKTSVYQIPDTVTEIWKRAFYGNPNITTVIMTHNLVKIEYSAFQNCVSLSKIELSDGLEYIGEGAFENTAFYNDETNWKESGLYLDKWFICPQNNSEKNYVIEDGTQSIACGMFSECRDLVTLVIPNSVRNINEFSTWWLSKFETIYFKGSEDEWNRIQKVDKNFQDIEIVYDYVNMISNNISIVATKNEIDSSAELVVTAIDNKEITESISEMIETNYYINNSKIYDIYFVKDNQKLQPNGKVTVRIPVQEDMTGEACKVFHISNLGNVEDMNAIYEDGHMVFTTDHFSYYALVELLKNIIGDFDATGMVDSDDAIHLLCNTLFGEDMYPLNQDADVNGDGNIDSDDAVYLLCHTLFGEDLYPLN